ncbi:MAG: hypothetical protein HY864_07150 [Chloroflexi bacterium]|nr:hypothetical protein [Chloroflexota bacterium]
MSLSEQRMEHGIALWKKDQRAEARKIFDSIVKSDMRNEAAWVWYIYSLETNTEKIEALKIFLSLFPGHMIGIKALENLRKEGGQIAVMPAGNKQTPERSSKTSHTKPRPAQSSKPAKWPISYAIAWLLTIVSLGLIAGGAVISVSQYNVLQSEIQALKSSSRIAEQNYSRLNNDFQSLKSTNTYLIYEYNNLDGKHKSLHTEYSQLAEKFDALAGDYDNLNDIALKPPYIVVHDRKVDATFYDTDGQLISWVMPFSDFEYDFENGAKTRSLVIDGNWQAREISRMDDSLLWVRDFSVFITPDAFQSVIPELYGKSSTPHEFIYRVWHMIGQLTHYASEELETPRYPLETMLAGGGDCEDLSILLASMIKAAPVDWVVDLVYVDLDNIQDPKEPNHIVVYINTGEESFIVEATSDQKMLPYDEGVTGWLAGKLQSTENPRPVYLH